MSTTDIETSAKWSFISISTAALFSVLVAGLASGPTVAAEDHADRSSGASVVARSGGFPALEARSPDGRGRSHASTTALPAYRVTSPDGVSPGSVPSPGGHVDGDGTAASAQSSGTDALALRANPESSRSKMMAPLVTVASSLAIVLALFSALVWAGRKFGGRATGSKPLPASALTPLGHVMLDPRTKLLLVKCGRRILVLSQTAGGITPITEVTHPDEVQELMASCSAEAREAFQRTLREVELEPTRGYTGTPPEQAPAARQSRRLFATA